MHRQEVELVTEQPGLGWEATGKFSASVQRFGNQDPYHGTWGDLGPLDKA